VIGLPPSVRIFVATAPADMRRSLDGLAAMTRDFLGEDPLSGHLFVFRSKTGHRVKILYWDRSGLCLWYKRLEKGVFRFPEATGSRVEVEAADLMLILEGIDLAGARRRKRFDSVAA
jgi:transposase